MADASDSKSDAGNSVWVQVPSPAFLYVEMREALKIRCFFCFIGFGCQKLKATFWHPNL